MESVDAPSMVLTPPPPPAPMGSTDPVKGGSRSAKKLMKKKRKTYVRLPKNKFNSRNANVRKKTRRWKY